MILLTLPCFGIDSRPQHGCLSVAADLEAVPFTSTTITVSESLHPFPRPVKSLSQSPKTNPPLFGAGSRGEARVRRRSDRLPKGGRFGL